jgi:hypothetical protein
VTDVGSRWLAQWADADLRAREGKDGQSVLLGLYARYRALSLEDRPIVDGLLAELTDSSDESVRFVALAMISEFRITSAIPDLRRLAGRLERADGPGAPYEWAKVNRIIAWLNTAAE